MTDDLIAFLRARLDEDEASARAATETSASATWRYRDGADHVSSVEVNEHTPENAAPWVREAWSPILTEANSYIGDHLDERMGTFVARNDPERALREAETKRRLVDLHHDIEDVQEMLDLCAVCEPTGKYPEYPCQTIQLLALPYVDHSDYRAEWKP